MTFPPHSGHLRTSRKALAWALFSQTIWLPAILIETQDRLSAEKKDYNFESLSQIPHQKMPDGFSISASNSPSSHQTLISQSPITNNHSGVVLNAISSEPRNISTTIMSDSSKDGHRLYLFSPPPPLGRPLLTALRSENSSILDPSPITTFDPNHKMPGRDITKQLFTRSDLLGGSLTLRDLNEPDMPPIARAERAQWLRSGDPLAPIPQMWREPMRRALMDLGEDQHSLSNIQKVTLEPARIVHVPSDKIKRSAEVPIALQPDGSVDILNQPDDPAVVREIQSWSSKQQLPSKGRLTPAVVLLHPIPEVSAEREPVTQGIVNSSGPHADPAHQPEVRAVSSSAPIPQQNPQPSSPAPTSESAILGQVSRGSEAPPQTENVPVESAQPIPNSEVK